MLACCEGTGSVGVREPPSSLRSDRTPGPNPKYNHCTPIGVCSWTGPPMDLDWTYLGPLDPGRRSLTYRAPCLRSLFFTLPLLINDFRELSNEDFASSLPSNQSL